MGSFSPHTFLTSQGWAGTGNGLRKDSIKKPVTVAHKTNLKGIGKERDTGYAWWDDVFSMVANKKKGSETPESRKTSTGIHSPLPPGSLSAATSAPTSGASTPVASTSTGGPHFHADLIGQAKLEAARREFYAKFMRGRPLAGTVSDDQDEEDKSQIDSTDEREAAAEEGGVNDDPHDTAKDSKLQRKLDKAKRKQEKEERRTLRKEKRDRKEKHRARNADPAAVSEVAGGKGPDTNPIKLGMHLASDTNGDPGACTQQDESSISRNSKKDKGKRKLEEDEPPSLVSSASGSDVRTEQLSKEQRKALKNMKKSKTSDLLTSETTAVEHTSGSREPEALPEQIDCPDTDRKAKKKRKEEKKRLKGAVPPSAQ